MQVTSPQAADVIGFVTEEHLLGEAAELTSEPMGGGVSSDVWLVGDGTRHVVVKTPLSDLRVAAGWRAPVARADAEARWLRTVADLVPGACPRVLAYDDRRHLLALEYLEPGSHTLWKGRLLVGDVDRGDAVRVGDLIGRIHRQTAQRPRLAADFANDEMFTVLRVEPYLERLVAAHPGLGEPVAGIVSSLAAHRSVLVHGDVSPKNILLGPRGPVLIDAETACWGDPAFDLAFCLNHLLLKCLVAGASPEELTASADALAVSYLAHVDWELAEEVAERTAELLPALMLARVDGRSPVEYLHAPAQDRVRRFAVPLLLQPSPGLSGVIDAWRSWLS